MPAFWSFCLIADLIVPVTMLIFGRVFQKKPPGEINGVYGYRTAMSSKNQKTWDYAHQVCGKVWQWMGAILLPVSAVPFFFLWGRDVDVTGRWCGIICGVQLIVMLGSIGVVESALHKKFDRYGQEKKPS